MRPSRKFYLCLWPIILLISSINADNHRLNDERILIRSSLHGTTVKVADLNEFIRANNLLQNLDIPLQTITSSNTLSLDGRTYKLDSYTEPADIFTPYARYIHNGKEGNVPMTNIYQSVDSEEIVTVFKNREQEIKSIHVMSKKIGNTTELKSVVNGIFATIRSTDNDYKDLNEKLRFASSHKELERNIDRLLFDHTNIERQAQEACGGHRQIELAVAYDSSFCIDQGTEQDANSKVAEIITVVSNLYQQEGLCTKVTIAHLEGFCDPTEDPYKQYVDLNLSGCGNDGLLDGIQQIWTQDRTSVHRDIMQLFTGTGLECDGGNTCVLGCSNPGTLCNDNSGYGATFVAFTDDIKLQGVLVAHELGHSCGAENESKQGYIMYEPIGASGNGFSSTTISTMNTNFKLSTCITSYITPSPSSSPSSAPSSFPSLSPSISLAPSSLPSAVPSTTPSFLPSNIPSTTPSFLPSNIPSLIPSSLPTASPSSISSSFPITSTPSLKPTSSLTASPTLLPSNSHPSLVPTSSILPSLSPSKGPSIVTVITTASLSIKGITSTESEEEIEALNATLTNTISKVSGNKTIVITALKFVNNVRFADESLDVNFLKIHEGECVLTCLQTFATVSSNALTSKQMISDSLSDGSFVTTLKEIAQDQGSTLVMNSTVTVDPRSFVATTSSSMIVSSSPTLSPIAVLEDDGFFKKTINFIFGIPRFIIQLFLLPFQFILEFFPGIMY